MGQKQSVTSQTNGDISALAKDLKLNGKELETPRMYPVDWKAGQMFTEEEDPDRMKGRHPFSKRCLQHSHTVIQPCTVKVA